MEALIVLVRVVQPKIVEIVGYSHGKKKQTVF